MEREEMYKLRSCPRCKGDVIIDRDHHGWYEQCLQCGYQRDLKGIVDATPPAELNKGGKRHEQRRHA